MPVNKVISVNKLHFAYQENEVLSDISFDVPQGDYIGIIGPNGSGKTTLIKLIMGLIRPTQGEISLFETDPKDFNAWYKIGYLPQKLGSFNPQFPATAKEIVALGLLSRKSLPKRYTKTDDDAINAALSLLGIEPLKNKLIGELSGGQLQRVLLARAIVHNPGLLILDEPTLALDPDVREKFFVILSELNKVRGTTILLITHDIGTIGKYASKLLYVDKRIVFHGGFGDFCVSSEAGEYFGTFAQHIICHRHD